jgi:outer membrane protein OmpA-like peptidoglycan-associated protein
MNRVYARVTAITIGMALSWAAPGQSSSTLEGSVGKSIRAVSYQLNTSSKVDLAPGDLSPQSSGEANIKAKQGVTNIEVEVARIPAPTKFGSEFLTYVLWVVSPEGRASNVGEIQLDSSGKGKLKVTTPLQTFSLFVTAEPYFAVRQPSEMVILLNSLRKDTKGKAVIVNNYQLITRSQYGKMGNPLSLSLDLKRVPLEVYEARNAVEIAKSRGAEKYAPEIFTKAQGGLQLTENALARKANRKEVISTARLTVQSSEDARALAVARIEEERIATEKAAAAAKAKADAEAKAAAKAAEAKRMADAEAAEAKRKADAEAVEAKRKADAEAAALKLRAEEEAQRQAELARAREAALKAKMEADAAAMKSKMEADALKAKEQAAEAEAERARKAAEELRAQLLGQLNQVLETKDSPRGLIVTMADVLFDVGKYDLRPTTREKLARLSGIVIAHKGLQLDIEGHTDSTGSDELNQTLSEKRAASVQTYLVQQGLQAESVTAKGFGKTIPVADNSTAAGRQQNRRVEIIVSGEVIGAKIGK